MAKRSPARRRWRDRKGRVLFVGDGISRGKSWATYWRKPNGSLKRSSYGELPERSTRAEAQADLDAFAERTALALHEESDQGA